MCRVRSVVHMQQAVTVLCTSRYVRSVSNTRILIDLHLSRVTHLHDAWGLSHVCGVGVCTGPRGGILKSPVISRKEFSLVFAGFRWHCNTIRVGPCVRDAECKEHRV